MTLIPMQFSVVKSSIHEFDVSPALYLPPIYPAELTSQAMEFPDAESLRDGLDVLNRFDISLEWNHVPSGLF